MMTSQCDACGGYFKNARGLAMHRQRSTTCISSSKYTEKTSMMVGQYKMPQNNNAWVILYYLKDGLHQADNITVALVDFAKQNVAHKHIPVLQLAIIIFVLEMMLLSEIIN
ncbi:MAG: hypothetical protein EXX96DRAFT_535758 [Benjaminiella poitrasii]|nr:MAG: hypothetical protein EXX96DRAFT_535758 [Benjaminiella poitrasii]